MSRMNFCPRCGKALTLHSNQHTGGRERPGCVDEGGCGFIDFGRYSLGVGGLVVEPGPEPKVLFIQRNEEPNKGGWTIPGGFVEFDELVETAVIREVEEETGLRCRVIGLVAYRSRVDPGDNSSYAVFYMEQISGELREGGNEEIAQALFLSRAELEKLEQVERVAPLSHHLAELAYNGQFKLLRQVEVPGATNSHWMLFS